MAWYFVKHRDYYTFTFYFTQLVKWWLVSISFIVIALLNNYFAFST